jgi:hypothetical protein
VMPNNQEKTPAAADMRLRACLRRVSSTRRSVLRCPAPLEDRLFGANNLCDAGQPSRGDDGYEQPVGGVELDGGGGGGALFGAT